MAKVTCSCGSTIFDISDDLPDKGHILTDQDYFEFFDEVERNNINNEAVTFDSLIEYFYEIFQCEECYRLIVFRDNKRFDFEMIEAFSTKQNILEKYHKKSNLEEEESFCIIDSSNYFNDKLAQMEHESKGWLSGISVNVLGAVYPLTFYTTYRFAHDIESELESKDVVNLNDYDDSNILFVKSITPQNVKEAIDSFVDMKRKSYA